MMMGQFIHHIIGKTTVKREDYINIRAAARKICEDNEDESFHLHTVMMMLYVEKMMSSTPSSSSSTPSSPSSHPQNDSPIPSWFTEGLPPLAGMSMSAKAILESMGRPTDIGACRQAGAWLRQLGSTTRKAGGSVVFDLRMRVAPAAKARKPEPFMDDDDDTELEDPFHPSIPVASRAIAYASSRMGGMLTIEEVAMGIGEASEKDVLREIFNTFRARGWECKDGRTFKIGNR